MIEVEVDEVDLVGIDGIDELGRIGRGKCNELTRQAI